MGGGDWFVLPPGIVCDSCNQYFGSKVEAVVATDYPLNLIRLMNGVITKKRKWATLPHYRGRLEARLIPGTIGIEPIDGETEQRILNGQITQLRVLAETRHPVSLCRMLLKIALETIARGDMKTRSARSMMPLGSLNALPQKVAAGGFVYHGDPSADWNVSPDMKPMSSGIEDIGGGDVALVEILDFYFIVPVTSNVIPDNLRSLPEPEFRFFSVSA